MFIPKNCVPDMPPMPDWLADAVFPLPPFDEHKWPDKVRRAVLAERAAELIWHELHDPEGMSEAQLRWLFEVLRYFRDHPRANDRTGWFRMDELSDGPRD